MCFYDVLNEISRPLFDKAVTRHQGDYRVRPLNCWTPFIPLLYGQVTHRQSLRDPALAFNSHANHHYRLGTQPIRRSTLADANEAWPVEPIELRRVRFINTEAR